MCNIATHQPFSVNEMDDFVSYEEALERYPSGTLLLDNEGGASLTLTWGLLFFKEQHSAPVARFSETDAFAAHLRYRRAPEGFTISLTQEPLLQKTTTPLKKEEKKKKDKKKKKKDKQWPVPHAVGYCRKDKKKKGKRRAK